MIVSVTTLKSLQKENEKEINNLDDIYREQLFILDSIKERLNELKQKRMSLTTSGIGVFRYGVIGESCNRRLAIRYNDW